MDKELIEVKGKEFISTLKALLKKGNATRLIIKKNNKIICNLPVTAVAVATLWAPLLMGLSLGVVLSGNYYILIEKNKPK